MFTYFSLLRKKTRRIIVLSLKKKKKLLIIEERIARSILQLRKVINLLIFLLQVYL